MGATTEREGEAPDEPAETTTRGVARRLALRVATARTGDGVRAAVREATEEHGLDRAKMCGVLEVLSHSEGALPDGVQRELEAILRDEACACAERDFGARVQREEGEGEGLRTWAGAAWVAGGESAVREVSVRVWSIVRPRGRAAAMLVDCVRAAREESLRVALYLALIERGADPRSVLADERALGDEARARVWGAFMRARNGGG